MDYSLPGSSVRGIFQARVLEWVGCHFLLQGIFLTWGSNLGLPHFRQMLYPLSHQGSLYRRHPFSDCSDRGSGKQRLMGKTETRRQSELVLPCSIRRWLRGVLGRGL